MKDNIPQSINILKKDPKYFNDYYGQNDNCYLRFIDTLATLYINTSNNDYLSCIDLISKYADGYVGDYLPATFRTLFENKFKNILEYLIAKRYSSNNMFEEFFIEALTVDFEDYTGFPATLASMGKDLKSDHFLMFHKEYFYDLLSKAVLNCEKPDAKNNFEKLIKSVFPDFKKPTSIQIRDPFVNFNVNYDSTFFPKSFDVYNKAHSFIMIGNFPASLLRSFKFTN